jgi:N4-(beta-N-acetylglucosaminyl)-L-asparaginase
VKKLNRRQFVQTTAAAGAAAAALPKTLFGQAPTMMTPKSVKPVVVSSSNGNKFKNGGTKTCVETAFAMITGGSDVLDALIAGVNIVELDPEVPGELVDPPRPGRLGAIGESHRCPRALP